MASALVLHGHNVIGLKRRQSNISRLSAVVDQIRLIDSDDGLTQVFEGNLDINLIIHTATSYGHNQESLTDVMTANVIMPLKLLELAVLNGNCAFINTDTFFSKAENTYPYLSNYIDTKKLFLELGSKMANDNNTTFCNLTIEHMYGPQDGNKKFNTIITQKLLNGIETIKLTPGMQTRDFVYVDDVVEAYLCVINAIKTNLIIGLKYFEVGSGELFTIKQFVTSIRHIIGSESHLEFGAYSYREVRSCTLKQILLRYIPLDGNLRLN